MPSDSGSRRAASGGAFERRKTAAARTTRTAATIQSVLRVRLFMKEPSEIPYHSGPPAVRPAAAPNCGHSALRALGFFVLIPRAANLAKKESFLAKKAPFVAKKWAKNGFCRYSFVTGYKLQDIEIMIVTMDFSVKNRLHGDFFVYYWILGRRNRENGPEKRKQDCAFWRLGVLISSRRFNQ